MAKFNALLSACQRDSSLELTTSLETNIPNSSMIARKLNPPKTAAVTVVTVVVVTVEITMYLPS
jgi:fumarate hydratase class II